MVYVRLEREWTDGEGTTHPSGTMVDVDAGTLAELEAEGIVADPVGAGSAPGAEATPATWAGPTGGSGGGSGSKAGSGGGAGTETWAGPTGGATGGSGG